MRVLLLLLLCSAPAAADDLAAQIKLLTGSADYKHARWGILVVDTNTGKTVYAQNDETFFAPASVTKLFSCAAALVALGPEYQFKTPVYAIGKVKDGELDGDLVLVAKGDLTFGSRIGKDGKTAYRNNDHIYISGYAADAELTDTNPVAAFDELAKQIKAAGVKSVAGEVLVDDRLFTTSTGSGSGPKVVSPMIANDNLIDITITPGSKPGEPAKITMRPETAYLRVDFDVNTGEAKSRARIRVNDADDVYSIRGEVPSGSKPLTGIVPITSPADFARTLFIEALKRHGVRVNAALIRHPAKSELPRLSAYEDLKPLAIFTSAPLEEAIEVTLKVSHNLYASTLPHLVAVQYGSGKSLSAGLKAQGTVLKKIGVDVNAISFGGGAGGANADHVTPRATVDLLLAMQKRPEWKAYHRALPVLGVDGTLASAVDAKSPAKGKVSAKTGTLGWDDQVNGRNYLTSKSLAGVMTTKNGTELTIAMFVNDVAQPPGVRAVREGKMLGKICETVYEHGP